jgi:hypothetical protein
MLPNRIAMLVIVCVCALTGVAKAGRAPAGPDFQSSPPSPPAVDTTLAASDGRAELLPIDVISFSFDSSTIDAISRLQLGEVARWLDEHPGYRVVVAGHTDAAGGDIYNLGLAARRANAVRDELSRYGIAHDRVVLAVYGKAKRPSHDPYAAANRVAVLYARPGRSIALASGRGPDLIDVIARALGQSAEFQL